MTNRKTNEKLAAVAIDKGVSTIVLLEGEAPEQHNPEPVTINGNIDAPSRFIEGRSEEFKESARHCMVSKTDGVIELIINEQSTVHKYKVRGKILISKKFRELGINDDNRTYEPVQLANRFKLMRNIFKSNLEHATICKTLRNLKATINAEIEKLDDRKGNTTDLLRTTVQSNMPEAITLKLPLLEGEEPVEIQVNVILEVGGNNGIFCYLESIDAAEMIEQQFEQRVNQEVEKIKDWVTVIHY